MGISCNHRLRLFSHVRKRAGRQRTIGTVTFCWRTKRSLVIAAYYPTRAKTPDAGWRVLGLVVSASHQKGRTNLRAVVPTDACISMEFRDSAVPRLPFRLPSGEGFSLGHFRGLCAYQPLCILRFPIDRQFLPLCMVMEDNQYT